jgi:hypothetical protein
MNIYTIIVIFSALKTFIILQIYKFFLSLHFQTKNIYYHEQKTYLYEFCHSEGRRR